MEFTLKDIAKSYIGGITDGEGCIFIQRQYDDRVGREKDYYRVSVIYAMTNPEPLRFIHTHYGGTLGHKTPTPSGKTVFRLTVGGNDALILLLEVEPFLLIKHRSAKAAIELQRHIGANFQRLKNGDTSVWIEREALYLAYRAAAETERAGVPMLERCDSPHLSDDKIKG